MSKSVRSVDYSISDGDSGIYETVNYMWHYALRDTKEPLVKRLVLDLRGANDLDTIRNIYNWVWRNVEYKLDPPDRELITAPIHFVNGNRVSGDCDCMTTLLVCLLESSGFESAITVIAWRLDAYTHVYAEVKYNNKWFVLDPTLKSSGFGKQDKKIRRFKRITKADMTRLEVLSDGALPSSRSSRRSDLSAAQIDRFSAQLSHPFRSRSFCRRGDYYADDDNRNRNNNNININFGTTTEHSYNTPPSDVLIGGVGGHGVGRVLHSNELPLLESNYERYVRGRRGRGNGGDVSVLYPNVDGTYRRGSWGERGDQTVGRVDQTAGQNGYVDGRNFVSTHPNWVGNSGNDAYVGRNGQNVGRGDQLDNTGADVGRSNSSSGGWSATPNVNVNRSGSVNGVVGRMRPVVSNRVGVVRGVRPGYVPSEVSRNYYQEFP